MLWFVLLGGAGAGLMMGMFYYVENGRFQACMLLGLATSLSMVPLVIFALDTPFMGEMSIGSEAYQLAYDQHMTGD